MRKILIAMSLLLSVGVANAQFGNLIDKAKRDINSAKSSAQAPKPSSQSGSNASQSQSASKNNNAGSTKENNGAVYYVNASTGSNRNDGKTPSTAFKDIQKLINSDFVKDGDIIRVAEGNYLGTLNQGFIEITNKYITLQGGYSSDFSNWDPSKYITKIEPTKEQAGTNGNKALITINANTNPNGLIVIDGFVINMGYENNYKIADEKDERTGTCAGCETGRMDEPENQVQHQLMKGEVNGRLKIRNCTFLNGNQYGIQMSSKGGHWEIYNNVFVACRYAACELRGSMATSAGITADFHHNTVLFSWCRTKVMEDMGYGFRFMNGMQQEDVHHNIFGCNNFGAIDNCRFENTKEKEAAKIQNVENNLFFMNNSDMVLPSAGGKWLMVSCDMFEDVDRIKGYEGNKPLPANSKLFKLINQPQLKGFANLKITSNTSYDRNSAQNQYRSAMGMNTVGTETVRVSMYGNRYPMEDAVSLFGAEPGYGAQAPVK